MKPGMSRSRLHHFPKGGLGNKTAKFFKNARIDHDED